MGTNQFLHGYISNVIRTFAKTRIVGLAKYKTRLT